MFVSGKMFIVLAVRAQEQGEKQRAARLVRAAAKKQIIRLNSDLKMTSGRSVGS